nr:RNA-directed DNA polymerase, eukaryota, reverse transcriptase zinc-binding domain protein [Tanacetum cinerariifolium]
SDHNRILLHVTKSDFGLTPFKLFHTWLLRDSYDGVIKTELPKLEEHNFGRKLLSHEKIRLLKDRIKQCHSKTKTSDRVTKHDNLQLIKSIEEKIKAGSANYDDRDSRIKLLQELGDSCSLDEVKNAVWDCGSSKALGPDRFSFAFVKKYWGYIKVDILLKLVYPHPGLRFWSMIVLPHNFLSNVVSGKEILSRLFFLFLLWRGWITLSTAVSSGLIRGVKFGSPEMSMSLPWPVILDALHDPFFLLILGYPLADLLSIRGRHTLIKVILGSIYYFSIFKVLDFVLNSLEGGFDNNGCIYNGTWARIVGSSNFLHSNNIIPNSSFCFQAGCGMRIRFWKDTWSMSNPGARNSANLLDMLFEINFAEINEVEDTCVWSLETDGTFSVRDARCIIDSKILPYLAPSTVWDKNIPLKFFIPSSKGSPASSIIGRLVLAATCYFIWRERNSRLFKKKLKTYDQIYDDIVVYVRLKVLTFRFKKNYMRVRNIIDKWKLSRLVIIYGSLSTT